MPARNLLLGWGAWWIGEGKKGATCCRSFCWSEADEIEAEHVVFDSLRVGSGGGDGEDVLSCFELGFAETDLPGMADPLALD